MGTRNLNKTATAGGGGKKRSSKASSKKTSNLPENTGRVL